MESKFEHSALEQDIEHLSAELKERHGEAVSREQLKTTLQEKISQAPTAPPTPAPRGHTGGGILPAYLQDAPDSIKLMVEKLLDLAWHKGVAIAAAEARKQGPLALDAFHDALTDRLYDELKKRGHIK